MVPAYFSEVFLICEEGPGWDGSAIPRKAFSHLFGMPIRTCALV
jgi:hypothetical protein